MSPIVAGIIRTKKRFRCGLVCRRPNRRTRTERHNMRSGPIATSLVLLLLSLVCPLGAAEEEAEKPVHPLDGAWRWSFTMPDGTASRPKVVLAVKQGSLTGIASFRPGTETPITNAVLKGDQLK